MSQQDDDAREVREAEALARALAGEAIEGAPSDALEVAALLRFARQNDVEIEQRVARARPAMPKQSALRLSKRVVLSSTLLAAAAILLLIAFNLKHERAPTATSPRPQHAALSTAERALLKAQARMLADSKADLGMLQEATRAHRAALFAELDARYGAAP